MTIEITHSRREGTLIDGTTKGSKAVEILKSRHYPSGYTQPARWSRTLGSWYLPHSRDKKAPTGMLEALAERLRSAGFTVTLTIDNNDRRSFAEAEAERVEKAEGRADRFAQYADNAATRSENAWKRGHQIADGIPLGQPVLVGHHSERRARRDQERIDTAMRTSIGERDRAAHWVGREQAAARYEDFRKNPARTLRRIAKLKADLRAVEKWQRGESAKGYSRNPQNPQTRQELGIEHAELSEEIEYWENVVAEAEAKGFKAWSKADFQRGDYVSCRGTWYAVLRANAKTLTVPHIFNGTGQTVVHADRNHYSGTSSLPYDKVTGRMSAEEMQQKQDTPK
ncbi:DUF3560 domain-containing protein [Streptomyces sp. NBC_00212]|uniref:DUF3560 domain-containing protein n=1 Tax=Streptomyces sp. NBC_00212 TaxID=2975684 RepID=UPI002F90E887